MPPLDELYGRLLLAYPEEYRKRHEAEMVSTLLDVARPGQVLPSWRESLSLVVGGLRTRAREAVRQGPRALWWDGLRLGAAALIAGEAGRTLVFSVFSGPYIRPHLLPLLLGLTVIVLMRDPRRWGLALIAADVVALWPAPLPAAVGGHVALTATLTPFPSGQWQVIAGPCLALALAAGVFALGSPASRIRRPWPWWIVGAMLIWPLTAQLLLERGVPFSTLDAYTLLVTTLQVLVSIGLGALSVVSHDPRPSVAAATYLAGTLVTALPFGSPSLWSVFQFMQPSLLLLAIIVAAVVVSSRARAHT